MKICKTCKIEKSLSEYWSHSRSRDRLQYSCKDCQLALRANYGRVERAELVAKLREEKEVLIASQTKICKMCKKSQPKKNFNRAACNVDGLTHHCKSCLAKWQKEHNLLPEVKESRRRWDREQRYKKYGTTTEEVDARIVAVGNACEICGSSFETARMHVDHFHDVGGLRGILCDYCNKGIGSFKESPQILIVAAEYMKRAYNLT